MPKSAQTGTQKKATKQAAHEYRKAGATREKGVKKSASFMHGGMRNTAIEKELKKTMGALEKYRHSEPYKGLSEFQRGGKAYKGDEDFSRLGDFGRKGKAYRDVEDFKQLKDFGVGGKAYKDQVSFSPLKDYERKGHAYRNQEDFSGLDPFGYKGKAYQKPDFAKDSQQGLALANQALAPIQQQTLKNYSQNTIPGLINSLGADSKKSSALNQALSTARNNLAENLNAQTAGLAIGYGGDISRMNLGERARQQEMQYGAEANQAAMRNQQQQYNLGLQSQVAQNRLGMQNQQQQYNLGLQNQTALQKAGLNIGQLSDIRGLQQQTEMGRAQMNLAQQAQNKALQYGSASDIFQGKRAASMGLDEQRRANSEYLNNLAMQASFNAQNAGLQQAGGAFQNAYLQKGPSSPSPWSSIGAAALGAAGTIGGAMIGGPAGAMAGGAAGSAISQPLFRTNQL